MELKEITAIFISISAFLLSLYNVFIAKRLTNRLDFLSIDDKIFELLQIIIDIQTIRESTLAFIRETRLATNKSVTEGSIDMTSEIDKSINAADICEKFIIENLESDKSIEQKIRSLTDGSIVSSKLIIATNKLRGEVKVRYASAKRDEAELKNIILCLKTQIANSI